jgi:ABC-type Mn2+/Zn2+ transport system ATPase subunit
MNPLASSNPLITLRDAAFGYTQQPIIRNVSLTIDRGEFIGLIGPNGAGKSTLFKGLLKLLPPLTGEVIHAPELYRRIGYVPQRDQLDSIYPLVAWDVVRMGIVGSLPWYERPGTRRHRDLIKHCLEQVGMSAYRDHPFAELSGGQRQRILIARALAVRPNILILDEPTAGIDPIAEETILELLTQLNIQHQIAVLMVSHHIPALKHRAHRIIVINHQKVVSGSAEELLHPDRLAELLAVTL